MLPASNLTEILANLSALKLQPNTAAQILAAVFAPLLRSSERELPQLCAGRPRPKPRKAPRGVGERPLASLRQNVSTADSIAGTPYLMLPPIRDIEPCLVDRAAGPQYAPQPFTPRQPRRLPGART